MASNEKRKSGFATASLVLGIIGLCTSFIPIVNNLSFILVLIAIVFAIVSLAKRASKGMAIAGIIISVITMILVVNSQQFFADSIDAAVNEVNDSIDTMSGANTDEVLKNNVDVEIGDFSVDTDSYGMTETVLPVTVENKSSETKSFDIQIEALDSDGSRIDTDYIYANNLSAGQSQDFKLFEYVEEEKLDAMKDATFKIVEASMY